MKKGITKLWILLVIFLGIIGVILYYFIGRKNKIE